MPCRARITHAKPVVGAALHAVNVLLPGAIDLAGHGAKGAVVEVCQLWRQLEQGQERRSKADTLRRGSMGFVRARRRRDGGSEFEKGGRGKVWCVSTADRGAASGVHLNIANKQRRLRRERETGEGEERERKERENTHNFDLWHKNAPPQGLGQAQANRAAAREDQSRAQRPRCSAPDLDCRLAVVEPGALVKAPLRLACRRERERRAGGRRRLALRCGAQRPRAGSRSQQHCARADVYWRLLGKKREEEDEDEGGIGQLPLYSFFLVRAAAAARADTWRRHTLAFYTRRLFCRHPL